MPAGGSQEVHRWRSASSPVARPGCRHRSTKESRCWPHIHFEVFASLAEATGGGTPIATSQLALPEDTCAVVYASDGYDQSIRNMERTSLESDNVFGDDGGVDQLATVTGSVPDGFVASLAVPV